MDAYAGQGKNVFGFVCVRVLRFMLELTTEQCSEYVKKIASLAESAGCTVCNSVYVFTVHCMCSLC